MLSKIYNFFKGPQIDEGLDESFRNFEKTESKFNRIYGWKKDLQDTDTDDLFLKLTVSDNFFPKQKFLTNLPPVYDQGHLGSCTANALSGAFEYEQIQQNLEDFVPSRLFIYYNERNIEGNVTDDSGAILSDGIKVLSTLGVCPETLWPYDIIKFSEKPYSDSYLIAKDHQVLASKKVPLNLNWFKKTLNMGYPIVFGFTVFESFESPETTTSGVMSFPEKKEKSLGGHAVFCFGYDDTMKSSDGKWTGFLKLRNSWGENWGDKGNFYMPYAYLRTNFVADAWIITKNKEKLLEFNNLKFN